MNIMMKIMEKMVKMMMKVKTKMMMTTLMEVKNLQKRTMMKTKSHMKIMGPTKNQAHTMMMRDQNTAIRKVAMREARIKKVEKAHQRSTVTKEAIIKMRMTIMNILIVINRVISSLRTMEVVEQVQDHKVNSQMQVQMKATQIFSRILRQGSTLGKSIERHYLRKSVKTMAARMAVTKSEVLVYLRNTL
jgi:hypothetical protein